MGWGGTAYIRVQEGADTAVTETAFSEIQITKSRNVQQTVGRFVTGSQTSAALFFFSRPPLFPFSPRALGCCREIRSSDKTRRVEGGGRFAGRNAARLVSAAGGNVGSSRETETRTNTQVDTHDTLTSTRTRQSGFTIIVLIRASVTIRWFKIIESFF